MGKTTRTASSRPNMRAPRRGTLVGAVRRAKSDSARHGRASCDSTCRLCLSRSSFAFFIDVTESVDRSIALQPNQTVEFIGRFDVKKAKEIIVHVRLPQ